MLMKGTSAGLIEMKATHEENEQNDDTSSPLCVHFDSKHLVCKFTGLMDVQLDGLLVQIEEEGIMMGEMLSQLKQCRGQGPSGRVGSISIPVGLRIRW
jgi:hypothetical protein